MLVMETDTSYRLHQSMGYQLTLTARVHERRLDEQLKSVGLTRITWCILLAVLNEGLVNPSDIARFVGIDRTATSRALRQMEEEGLILRSTGKKDGRTTLVKVTDAGLERHQQATPKVRSNAQYWQDKLTETEVLHFCRLMRKLRRGEDVALKQF